ncbi:stromal cell-derived factor 2-like protein 1 [Zophobas morio]|uniref:stromal cell-derived factor 2-like protein 1 n=1 Tax=Zophobas morio TaxID=2755281 RepID=UPI00308350B4
MFLFLFIFLASSAISFESGYEYVTCGSIIKLKHDQTKYNLHSHPVTYGSGSHQQSVTSNVRDDDPNSYWQVQAAYNQTCRRGEPIKCNSLIRLFHVNTQKFLHSHRHKSPLTHRQEVSAYGSEENVNGDSGDNWEIKCKGSWKRESTIQLKHVDTGALLSSGRYTFPMDVVRGQNEVHCKFEDDLEVNWHSWFGVYFSSEEASAYYIHNEL